MSDETEIPSFEEVAADLYHPLRRYLENYVGDQTVAEDLLQETLLKISNGLSSFAGRSSIKTWAFTIAYRVRADYFRAPQKRTKFVDLDETEEQVDDARAVDENLIAGPKPTVGRPRFLPPTLLLRVPRWNKVMLSQR